MPRTRSHDLPLATGPGTADVEAPVMAGQQVRVAGGANSAGQAALHLARSAARDHAAHRGESPAASVSGYLITHLKATPDIGVRLRTRVAGGHGQARPEALTLEDIRTCQREQLPAAAVFVMTGAEPRTPWHRDPDLRKVRTGTRPDLG